MYGRLRPFWEERLERPIFPQAECYNIWRWETSEEHQAFLDLSGDFNKSQAGLSQQAR
jgi:hypothetical protein